MPIVRYWIKPTVNSFVSLELFQIRTQRRFPESLERGLRLPGPMTGLVNLLAQESLC